MPYIKKEDREVYDVILNKIPDMPTKGDLEYCIFKLMCFYMERKAVRYSTLHDTVYAAAHCADEFRRRFLDRREDQAMGSNGDIDAAEGFTRVLNLLSSEIK